MEKLGHFFLKFRKEIKDTLMAIYAYCNYKPPIILINLVQNSRRDTSLFIFPGNITEHSKISECLVSSCYRSCVITNSK
jgi:hypothetical protein